MPALQRHSRRLVDAEYLTNANRKDNFAVENNITNLLFSK